MVFSSPIFLFLFLPVVLALCAVGGLRWRNGVLLLFSVIFYAWGEVVFVLLMLGSALLNHFLGRWVDRENEPSRRKWAVGVAVALNIGTLAFFKYANFAIGNLNALLVAVHVDPVRMDPVRLPIGISFFTFHALSYVIDVYRRKRPAAKNPCDVALYIFFFPQLIAGPILRWSAIAPQLVERVVTRAGFADGVRRFVGGFAKKMIIANVVALPADKIFALPGQELTPSLAWLAVICYTMQIYFDFSGYSDMAVGLGKMFGFQFLENFNFPYIAQSIKDFWRRWHISLSSWFRDYLYIPLGGNRCSPARCCANLVIVFLLCGLWHGASWNFAVWGLYHGFFLAIERMGLARLLAKAWRPLQHFYAVLVIMSGWVFFRAESLAGAGDYLRAMVSFTSGGFDYFYMTFVNRQFLVALAAACLFSAPVRQYLVSIKIRREAGEAELHARCAHAGYLAAGIIFLFSVFIACAMQLAGDTYSPFIYTRF